MAWKHRSMALIRPTALLSIFLFSIFHLFILLTPALAKVTGECVNCHTMHNSQGGTLVNTSGPFGALVNNTCLGCHTGTNTSSSTIPYVMSTAEPTYNVNTLAGGNFYWVKRGYTGAADSKGHNIFLNEVDGLSEAPGSKITCGTNSCHQNLSLPYDGTPHNLDGKYGCQGCHLNPRHHADDGSGDYKFVNSAAKGWYRFLSGHMSAEGEGVIGLEDKDWEYTKNQNDHNEYLGEELATMFTKAAGLNDGNSATLYCCGCHGNFHVQKNTSGAWIRHPSDAVLPDRDPASEYEAYTQYNTLAPVARPLAGVNVSQPSSSVQAGTDMVMCLSCHRPHGSPYADILRWPYTPSTDALGTGSPLDKYAAGCVICHTQKIPYSP